MSQQTQNIKINYHECSKGGYHTGELLNFVNLEHKSKEDLLFCSACMQENPKIKNLRPMKLVLNDVKSRIQLIKSQPINPEQLLLLIQQTHSAMSNEFQQQVAQWNEKFKKIQEGYDQFFGRVKQQVKVRGASAEQLSTLLGKFLQSSSSSEKILDLEDVRTSLQRLLAIGPHSTKDEEILDSSQIKSNFNTVVKDLRDDIAKQHAKLNEALADQLQIFEDNKRDGSIWREQSLQTSFAPALKQMNVTIVNPTTAKSGGISPSYKLALLDTPLNVPNQQYRFSYKIQELNVSNWLAFGFCYQSIIASQNYAFNFSTINHGAYMVSSNGASWSHHLVAFNNQIKSFQFTQNDVVWAQYDPNTQTATFGQENSQDTYSLVVNVLPNDVLHPCVCFYYVNDEIELTSAN